MAPTLPSVDISDWEADLLKFVDEGTGGIIAQQPAKMGEIVKIVGAAKEVRSSSSSPNFLQRNRALCLVLCASLSQFRALVIIFLRSCSGTSPCRVLAQDAQQELAAQILGNSSEPVLAALVEAGLLFCLKDWLRAALDAGGKADRVIAALTVSVTPHICEVVPSHPHAPYLLSLRIPTLPHARVSAAIE